MAKKRNVPLPNHIYIFQFFIIYFYHLNCFHEHSMMILHLDLKSIYQVNVVQWLFAPCTIAGCSVRSALLYSTSVSTVSRGMPRWRSLFYSLLFSLYFLFPPLISVGWALRAATAATQPLLNQGWQWPPLWIIKVPNLFPLNLASGS